MMLQKFFFFFLFLGMTLGLNAFSPAHAGYKGDTMEEEVKIVSPSLFPRGFYGIEFFNTPSVSESAFVMRLSSYGEVTGCTHQLPSETKLSQNSDRLKLKIIKDVELQLDEEPRYSNYDCDIKRNNAFIDLNLDRDTLIRKKIKHFKLTSDKNGDFIDSDIDINEQRIIFTTKTPMGDNMLTFWFFPANAVILFAPQAKLGQNVQEKIREFGIAQGLTPMEDAMKSFELPYTADHYMFFTDPAKRITRQINEIGENVEVGHIYDTRTVHGANGAQSEPYEMMLFATLPGQPTQ